MYICNACASNEPGFVFIIPCLLRTSHVQWNLADLKSLGPEGVQISEMFGFVKCI